MKLGEFATALWRGLISGTQARERSGAPPPQHYGFDGSIAQALYWLGFEIGNVVVFGKKA
jgi:hypothetical protein